jgi:glutamine phosphoribosylpyrophosphate amidotransferase
MNGILCISSKNDISLDTYLNYLDYIQHRGKRAFGYLNDSMIHINGLIENYKQYDNYTSTLFLGYTTKYSNNIDTRIECKFGSIDIVIDGEEKNYKLFERFVTAIDNETIEEGLIEFIKNTNMAYSIIVHINNIIYVMIDKYGIKPLMYTITEYGFHVSSEINGNFKYVNIIDVDPGSILKIDNLTLSTIYSESTTKKHWLYNE